MCRREDEEGDISLPPFRLFIEVSVSCICNEDEASDKTQLNWCYQRQTKRDVPCFSVIVSF